MRGKSLALLVLALGCGLVASIGITQVISKQDKKPVVQSGDTQAIFVAMADIPFGEPLTSQELRLEEWPKDKVPEGALTTIEDVEGRRTRAKLYAGEPILEKKLFEKGADGLGHSARIPKGYRVVSVRVDIVSGSASLILPGDRVDVMLYLTRSPTGGTYEATTRTILQDIKVFAVNDVVGMESDQGGKSINAQTISLLVTPGQAQEVMLASEMGKIRLVMRSPEDDVQSQVGESTLREIFGLEGGSDRDKEKEAVEDTASSGPQQGGSGFRGFLDKIRAKAVVDAPSALPTLMQPGRPSAERHMMRIVSGGEISNLVLEAETDESIPGYQRWKLSSGPLPLPGGPELQQPAPTETPPAVQPTEPGEPSEPKAPPGEQPPAEEEPAGAEPAGAEPAGTEPAATAGE
ncbi:MAG: Flp pilus assembly protein CpaB [Pirellulales bacterium]|nr:Flp pilus assembly protein CpaB [Pirellulales bacterium]